MGEKKDGWQSVCRDLVYGAKEVSSLVCQAHRMEDGWIPTTNILLNSGSEATGQ